MKMEMLGTLFFALAVLHTFVAGKFRERAHHLPSDSFRHGVMHFLGEVEVVFGIWAGAFLILFAVSEGVGHAVDYLDSVNFTEPLFVFVIMAICATRPVLDACRAVIVVLSRGLRGLFRTPEIHTELFVILAFGPLAGSLITEPAAMTVTAFLLASMIHTHNARLLYFMLGTLFVNVSIGGALTPFAAPPILMVASTWKWDFAFVMTHLGWKSAIAVVINSLIFVIVSRKKLAEGFYTLKHLDAREERKRPDAPWGVTLLHFVFLLGVIVFAHHPNVFMGLFLFFLGTAAVTKKFQDSLRLKESLLVAFFLGGIIVFGPFQTWWLQPLLQRLGEGALFGGATALTAITDNAALTYLGSQVADLAESSRYALVAGALAGGGLTVIANAPNPAGYSILQGKFPGGIKPLGLLAGALAPTAVALVCLWFLPHL